jgi:hypothetical protein
MRSSKPAPDEYRPRSVSGSKAVPPTRKSTPLRARGIERERPHEPVGVAEVAHGAEAAAFHQPIAVVGTARVGELLVAQPPTR